LAAENGKGKFGKNLLWRVIMAVVFVPIFLWISWLGGVLFFLYVEALILLGMVEYNAMLRAGGHQVKGITGILASLACGTLFFLYPYQGAGITMVFVFSLLVFLLLQSLLAPPGALSLEGIGLTIFGVIYVGFFFSHQILLREGMSHHCGSNKAGWYYLLFPYLIVWVSDTSAYFTGKFFGRHKLAPLISPGKSVEGAIGGLLFSVTAALVYSSAVPGYLTSRDALILGLIVAIVCQAGDMFESLLKRAAGVKDSSSLIPGHGGILDRYDGILVSVPISYYYFIWISPLLCK